MYEKIDTHCHVLTPAYKQYTKENNQENPDGIPASQIADWTPEAHIQFMTTNNITKSILSITSPGTNLKIPYDPSFIATKTREFNEELSVICSQYPTKFSFFASLPIPSVSDSISEIDYALDKLGAVGFALLSNTNGIYLGDPSLSPIFKKLNERNAIIFIHPTTSNIITSTNPSGFEIADPLPYPRPMMEFMFDETRAVVNLLLTNTISSNPNIKWIMSHGGASLPSVIDRVGAFSQILNGGKSRREEFLGLIKSRFWFDLAGMPFETMMKGLLDVLGEGAEKRLLYGSDYPLTPPEACGMLAGLLERGVGGIWGEEEREKIWVGNARELFGL